MDWKDLTKEIAEEVYLSQAKKYAVSLGYPESVVFRCTCDLVENTQTKTFSCALGTLAGVEEITIVCDKLKQSCTINSSRGNMEYSFKEIDKLI